MLEYLNKLNTPDLHNNVCLLLVSAHIRLKTNGTECTLAKKLAGLPLCRPEPFCGIGKGFMIMALGNTD